MPDPDVKLTPTKTVPLSRVQVGENTRLFTRRVDELARTIAAQGLIHPLTVKKADGGKYQLLAGYRRYQALCLIRDEPGQFDVIVPALKRKRILVEVRIMPCNTGVLEGNLVNLSENYAREDISTWELGQAIKKLCYEHDLLPSAIAERAGISVAHANNCMRIVEKICPEIASQLDAGIEDRDRRVSSALLFHLCRLPPKEQVAEWQRIQQGIQPGERRRGGIGYVAAWSKRKARKLLAELPDDEPIAKACLEWLLGIRSEYPL